MSGDRLALPSAVRSVVVGLRAVEQGTAPASLTPKVRLRVRSGHWLVLYAARLQRAERHGQIAVMFEVAQPAELAPLIMQAYDLTKREGEITQCVLLGWSTAEIATRLRISPHTVQDHLKAIFAKVGVSSRGELAQRIFIGHYQPQMAAGQSLDATGQ
jgi:DNA-binding CsgD family transcriptional regulator